MCLMEVLVTTKVLSELLSAVPDTSVVRPDSATNFVELISQLPIQFSLENPAVEDAFDLATSDCAQIS